MVLQAVIEILCAQWKQCDPLGILFHIVEKKLCIAVVTAIVMALRSLIKTESRTAKLRQVESHCRGLTGKWTSEWMNTNLYSFALCQFVLSWFFLSKWSAFEKNPSARLGMLSFNSMLPLKFQGTWMKSSNRILYNILCIFLKYVWISFPINAKNNLLQHLLFSQHTYLLELHLQLNSGSSFHLYRSLSLF